MSERKPFEIQAGGYELELMVGKCVVSLFRKNAEVDYLTVDITEETGGEKENLRIFRNEELCRWMAGYCIRETEDGHFARDITTMNGDTFRSLYGWNPAVIEREEPNEREKEDWLDLQASSMDDEWERGL